MKNTSKTAEERLFQIASEQQGYFCTAQAIEAGFQDATHPYHVKIGDWIREWRGIYRISRYPQTEEGHYALWSLWSRNRQGMRQGIYSHQTALSLFDLSDIMPDKLHITVPPSFRRHSEIPGVLVLHRGIITHQEVEEREGYSVTRPVRAIIDLIVEESVSMEILRQAFKESKKRGLLRDKDLQRYLSDSEIGRKIQNILGEIV
jgi:predicted transcriptional regulator of viral defense system